MGGLQVQREQCFVVVSADSYCLLFSHKKTNIGLACVWLRCLLSLVPRTAPLAFLFFSFHLNQCCRAL